jgi:hypothetical protein
MAAKRAADIARGWESNECKQNSYTAYRIPKNGGKEYKFTGTEAQRKKQLNAKILEIGEHKTYKIGSVYKTYYSKDGSIQRQLDNDLSPGHYLGATKVTVVTFDHGRKKGKITKKYNDLDNNKAARADYNKEVAKAKRDYNGQQRVDHKPQNFNAHQQVNRRDNQGTERPKVELQTECKSDYERKARSVVGYKKLREVIFDYECENISFIYAKRTKRVVKEGKNKGRNMLHTESCRDTRHPKELCWCVNQKEKRAIMAAIRLRLQYGTIVLENQIFETAADVRNAKVSRDNVKAKRGDYFVIWTDNCKGL